MNRSSSEGKDMERMVNQFGWRRCSPVENRYLT